LLKGSLRRSSRGLTRLAFWHPGWVLIAWATALAGSVPGVLALRVDTSTESVLLHHDEAWSYYQRSLELFGGDEVIVVALEGEYPFDPALLRLVDELTQSFRLIPGVRRVDSLATVPFVRVEAGGTLNLEPAIDGELPTGEKGFWPLGERLLREDRIAPRLLVSEDGRTLAINLLLEENAADYERIFGDVEHALEGQDAWISGVPVFRAVTNLRTLREASRFVPLTLLVLGVVIWIGFGSLRAVFISLGIGATGTWLLLAIIGASDIPFMLSTSVLPPVMLALGCAYSVHLLSAAHGAEPERLLSALESTAPPIALSGITTGIGFLAMAVVDIDAIRYVAVFGAIGTFSVLVATLTLGTAALRRWPLPDLQRGTTRWVREAVVPALLGFVGGRPHAHIIGWLVLVLCAGAGTAQLRVETDVTRWFEPGTTVRDSYERIRERLSGISPMNIVLESREGRRITEPEVLERIAAFQEFLESDPRIGRVLSLVDPLSQLHAGFDGSEERLPGSDALVEQYLLLLESVEPIDDLVTADRTWTNIVLRLNDNGSQYLLNVSRAADAWWQENGADGVRARTTGVMYEFARAADEIAWGQIKGLSLALVAIAAVLFLAFRSWRNVGIALIPNVVPLGVAFGMMGWLGVALDAGTVLIGNLALGIAVDDTVHLIDRFQEEGGSSTARYGGLDRAIEYVLPALTYTTFAVACGFFVLGISEFTFIRNLGLVTGAVVILCYAADVGLLPVLLAKQRRR